MPALLTSQSLLAKLICLLSITSLLASAYMLLYIPLVSDQTADRRGKRPVRDIALEPESGPLKRYLGLLNGALSMLVSFNAIRFRGGPGVHDGFWLLCLVPGCR